MVKDLEGSLFNGYMTFKFHKSDWSLDALWLRKEEEVGENRTNAKCSDRNLELRDTELPDRTDDDLENEPEYLKCGDEFDE